MLILSHTQKDTLRGVGANSITINVLISHSQIVAQVRAYVEQVIDMVDLTDQSFSLVGLPGATGGGLSTEQLKRLTIAVELVANPSVVFLDEPTSGRLFKLVWLMVWHVADNPASHDPTI